MRTIPGIGASPGVVWGPAYVLEPRQVRIPEWRLEADQVEAELERLREALRRSYLEVESLRKKLEAEHREPNMILEAQALMLKDEALFVEPSRLIREDLINAEWAFSRLLAQMQKAFSGAEDDYLRERGADIGYVGERILRLLTGERSPRLRPSAGAVVVAHELSPAEVVHLHRAGVVGLVTEVGGRSSHTALMARAFRLPAVVGLRSLLAHVHRDEVVAVDGLRGEVVLRPSPVVQAEYDARARALSEEEEELQKEHDLPAVTLDGRVVRLLANIELEDEVEAALAQGAQGVGLYRTEFLFMNRDMLPSEAEHAENATRILVGMQGRPVTFRTFDLGGGEKSTELIPLPTEENPALGLRSIRLAFREREVFRSQLRGLLRASGAGRMRIMFPMVSSVQELREARAELDRCREDIQAEGISVPDHLEIGIMVEMPAAAMIADLLAKECDFFAIGSNDLIQYSLAIDRDNDLVNYLYHPLHPAILRTIRFVVRVAHTEGIRVSLCGEMAAEPMYALVLLGLGLDELSMPSSAIARIKRIVRKSTVAEARTLAEELVRLPTVQEIEARVVDVMCPRFLEHVGPVRAGPGGAKLSCEVTD